MKDSKKGACSSNTQKAKINCLQHARRNNKDGKLPDYVNPHLTCNNRTVFEDDMIRNRKSIYPLMKKAEMEYTEKTGQKCQASFAPFREAVLHIKEGVTDEQMMQFKADVEKETGWKVIGMWMHLDEGHQHTKYIEGDTNFELNFHVHCLFDCIDHATGKAIRCTRVNLSHMQDILAKATDMERGNYAWQTGRKHRKAAAERAYQQELRAEKMEEKLASMEGMLADLSSKKEQAEKRVKGLTTMVANLNDRVLILEGEIAKREIALEDTDDLQKQHDELLAKLEDKKQKLQAAHDKLWDLSNQYKNILDHIDEAKKQRNEISGKRNDEENKLTEVQKKVEQTEKELHVLVDKGENQDIPKLSVVEAYEYSNGDFPSISIEEIPTVFKKKEWAEKKNKEIEEKCRKLVDNARKPLEEQVNKQNEVITEIVEKYKAEKKLRKGYECKNSLRTELDSLAKYAVKAIVDYITSDKKAENLRRQLLWAAKQAMKKVFEHAFKIEPYGNDLDKATVVTFKAAYSVLYELYKLVSGNSQRVAGHKFVEDAGEEQVNEISKRIQTANEKERNNVGFKR